MFSVRNLGAWGEFFFAVTLGVERGGKIAVNDAILNVFSYGFMGVIAEAKPSGLEHGEVVRAIANGERVCGG